MAERRMFAKIIIDSDDFLDMPLSSQALYFHLSMRAYDKGIVINARAIAKSIGASIEDINILVENHFIVPEESSYRIVHWYENNGIGETAKKRNNYSYRKWRELVLKRDGYTCKICGTTSDLQVHHIKSFAEYPELRFEVGNGMTLCERCHREVHRLWRHIET